METRDTAVIGCRLGFDRTGNSAIRSADPDPPSLEPNIKWIEWPVAEIWLFEIHISRTVHLKPQFEGSGGRRGSSIVPLERAMVVSYRLPIVHCTICKLNGAIELSATLNSTGGRSLLVKMLGVFSLE